MAADFQEFLHWVRALSPVRRARGRRRRFSMARRVRGY